MPMLAFQFVPTFTAMMVGVFAGLTTTYLVGQSLVELHLSEEFGTAIGLFLLILGSMLIWRVQREEADMSSSGKVQRYIVLAFGTLVLMSGTFCFILEKSWMIKLGPAEKVPMYISLSVALSFAYVFSIVEILNYCHAARYQHPNQFVPIISSTQQVCINLVACVICGVYFGLLFSLMELGQENNPVAIHRDRLYTFPVGMIFGGLVGGANYFSAVRSSTYDPLDINMA